MDLRVVKTKKNIREAFLEMRRKYSVDEIKVNALCEKAMINKTTFYNHYRDIFELSEELEREVIDAFFHNFTDIDKMLTDSSRFIGGMHHALETTNDVLRIVFKDKFDELTERIEKRIRQYYVKEEQLLISFLIGGSIHLMMKSKADDEELENFLIEVIQKVAEMHS